MSDQVRLALEAQAERDSGRKALIRYGKQIEWSISPHYNWQDSVSSIPVAISAVAACLAASFSKEAQDWRAPFPDTSELKYIRTRGLGPNFQHLGTLGYGVLQNASFMFKRIDDQSNSIGKLADDITFLDLRNGAANTSVIVPFSVNAIRGLAEDISRDLSDINQQLGEFLDLASELHAICVGSNASNEEKAQASELHLAVAQQQQSPPPDSSDVGTKAKKKARKQVATAYAAFKQTALDAPDGLDVLACELVQGQADAIAATANCFLWEYSYANNPMSKAMAGPSPFQGLLYPGSAGDNITIPPTPKEIQPLPPSSTDPAYAEIPKALPLLNLLNAILTSGTTGAFDWKAAKTNAQYISKVFHEYYTTFSGLATSDQPSVYLIDILSNCADIAHGVNVELVRAATSYAQPSPNVDKDWQTRFQGRYERAQQLLSVVKSLPGNAPSSIPFYGGRPDRYSVDTTTVYPQAVAAAIKTRFGMAQSVMQMTQDIHATATMFRAERQTKINDIQGRLDKAVQQAIRPDQFPTILQSTIKVFVNIRQSVLKSLSFFQALPQLLDIVMDLAVKPLLKTVQGASVSSGPKLGQCTEFNLQASALVQLVWIIYSHVSVINEMASKWVYLSEDYISESLILLDDLYGEPYGDPYGEMKRKRSLSKLQYLMSQAANRIKELIEADTKKVQAGMATEIEEIESVTQQLPLAFQPKGMIIAGTSLTKKAAVDAITANAQAKPLNHFPIAT